MCVLATPSLEALTKTYLVPFDNNWPTSGWACGDALPIVYNGMYGATFTGGLPVGSNVTNVRITMPMRRAAFFNSGGDVNPVVTVSIEGQQIAAPTVAR